MRFLNKKRVFNNNEKELVVKLQRLPFSDRSNEIMQKESTKNKQKATVRKDYEMDKLKNITMASERIKQPLTYKTGKSRASNSKVLDKNKVTSQIVAKKNTEKNHKNGKKIELNTDLKINKPISSNILQNHNVRQSTPLVKRLRKGCVKEYRESSLEDSVKSSNETISSNSKTKVPIYRQPMPISTKTNKDPYALDFNDFEETKKKKLKRANNSEKFNKTMHNILKNIEKNEKKKVKKTYQECINNVLERVLLKISHQKGQPVSTNPKNKNHTSTAQQSEDKFKSLNEPVEIKNGFKRFQNDSNAKNLHLNNSIASVSSSSHRTSIAKERSNNFPEFHGIEDGFCGFAKDHSEVFESTKRPVVVHPSTSRTNPATRINILSDVSLNSTKYSQHEEPEYSYINVSVNSTDHETNKSCVVGKLGSLKSLKSNPLEKSYNLLREFQEITPISSEHSIAHHHPFNEELDTFNDTYAEDSEVEEDEYFGFQEENNTTQVPVKKFRQKRKNYPWRFQGYFKRNPHILKIKKNGLPCLQQEMVMDYEFVKKIEALSANKTVERPPPRAPLQTTMLDYIESSHGNQDQPTPQPSLFDYEEFNVAKTPRKVFGVLHDNHQFVSTPNKEVRAVVVSPNVSIIAKEGDEENSPLSNHRLVLQKSYRRKEKTVENEDILPSILDKDYEEEYEELNIFEDVDNEKKTNFSITLPDIKYGKKRRRRKSENGDEKKTKKKNMMTKAEEADFEAWAAQTNARFAEEDKYELTIE